MSSSERSIHGGFVLALLAAASFGVTTPLVQRLGRGVGPFTTAALLYLRAAIVALAIRRRASQERRRCAGRTHRGSSPWPSPGR
jgi:drug/metabolite transporter (DMT)-like permease